MDTSRIITEAAGMFDPHEMPERYRDSEYARGVTDLATRLLGYTADDMDAVWGVICAEAVRMLRTGRT